MRFARGFVLLLALSSAGGAALVVQKAPRSGVGPVQAARAETIDILVAARAIGVGDGVGKAELRWQPWPAGSVPAGSIRRVPGAVSPIPPFEAATARYAMLEGEPLSEAKLLRPNDGSALAALLAPGMRAVSVPIRDETAVGGFIQPGDRVDVMVTRKQNEGGGRETARSHVLLRGVKVLAIGKALSGKAVGAGRTATLEIPPLQVSLLSAAQSGAEISLALIGARDAGDAEATDAADIAADVRMLKYGRSANRQTQQ